MFPMNLLYIHCPCGFISNDSMFSYIVDKNCFGMLSENLAGMQYVC